MPSFEKAYNMKGFDSYRINRWQMVPLNGTRYIILRDGAGLTVSSTDPAKLLVTEVTRPTLPVAGLQPISSGDRFLKLEGKNHGAVEVHAKNAVGLVVKTLEVNIKRKKTVNISFNFVRDNAGHRTLRNTSQASTWVTGINWIYFGQTNIEMKLKLFRNVTVAQNLGSTVMFTSHIAGAPAGSHEWDVVVATGDATADMNFFLVWDYEQDFDPATDTDAGTLAGNCIFEDNAGTSIAETMAHEIGHYLGVADHYVVTRKRELMYGITDSRGIHIPKDDANTMNP